MFSEQMMDTSINGNTFQLLLKDGTTTKIPATVTQISRGAFYKILGRLA
jgi:hypothetical protein